jgi:hypothetical protein
MKLRFVVVGLVALLAVGGFTLSTPAIARVQTGDGCVHQPTLDSLKMCVKHAAAEGFINSEEVMHRLLAKLDMAEEAVDDGYTSQAIHLLRAFIHEVKAQSGKHIVSVHAEHLVMHAQMVIQALEKESS